MSTEKNTTPVPVKHYFNIAQFRSDCWSDLKAATADLLKSDSGKKSPLNERIERNLKLLTLLEQYWAFPGTDRVEDLKEMYQHKELQALSNRLNVLVRALVSDSYREPVRENSKSKTEKESPVDEEDLDQKVRQNYFELLFVDTLEQHQIQSLKRKLKNVAHRKDPFAYDAVAATTFQDALLAVIFNPNIQACVIRYGLPLNQRIT